MGASPEGGARGLSRGLSLLVRVFFRRLEVVGLENVPGDRGGLLVAWHPNGLVDPALILSAFPGRVVFGARHGLFRYPLLGRLMKAIGTVPVYRRQDMPAGAGEDPRTLNDQSMAALAAEVAAGSFAALFPEGISHDAPFLKELKTGAARLYYRARQETAWGGTPGAGGGTRAAAAVGGTPTASGGGAPLATAVGGAHPTSGEGAQPGSAGGDLEPASTGGGAQPAAPGGGARSATTAGRPPPVVLPVGLHYDQKRVFRSSALVVFHPPLELPPELDVSPAPDEDPERVRELARGLTERIEGTLREVVLETESWEEHRLLHRARKLIRAERAARAGKDPGGASMDERVVGLTRMWVGYRERLRTHPEEVAQLRKRVERYHRDMKGLDIEDHELDQPPPLFRPWLWVVLLSQAVSVFFVLPPFLVIGYLVNFPPALLLSLTAHGLGREEKDVATLKVLGGLVLFPFTWALWGWLATWDGLRAFAPWMPQSPLLAAGAMVGLSVLGALVMLFYVGLALSTWRALRVRLTRGRRAGAFVRLKVTRTRLCDELLQLSRGLELPGVVLEDGRVHRAGYAAAGRPLGPSVGESLGGGPGRLG